MPTTTVPTRLFPDRITGRRAWKAKPSTIRATAASRPKFASVLLIGRTGEKSCNKPAVTTVSRQEQREHSDVPGRRECLLAGSADELGPKGPDCPPHHRRDLDRGARSQVGAPKSDRQESRAPQARHRNAGRDDRPSAGRDRQAHYLAGRHHGRAEVPRNRPDTRADQRAHAPDFRLP